MSKKWTEVDKNTLKKLLEEDKSYSDISVIMDRSYKSIEHAVQRYKSDWEDFGLKMSKNDDVILIKKANVSDIYNIAFKGIRDCVKKLEKEGGLVKPIKSLTSYSKNKKVETANLVISDYHCGKLNKLYYPPLQREVETYNDNIRHKMQNRLLASIAEVVSLLKHGYYFEKLNIFLLGDIIEGDGYVFEGQQFNITKVVGLQVWDAIYSLKDMILELHKLFPKIDVTCLVGNHGLYTSSRGADMPVENYLEYHLYRALQLLLERQKNITITVPTTKFYSVNVYDKLFFLSHGDNIRGFSKTTRVKKAKDIYINLPTGFDLYCIAHYHNLEKDNIGDKGVLLTNGAWIPFDSYAQKLFGIYSEPKQWFFFSNKNRPITMSFELDFKGIEIVKGLKL